MALTGKAEFQKYENGMLQYFERVENGSLVGTRSYIFENLREKTSIYFIEKPLRLFVSLPDYPIHQCGKDRYEVAVRWDELFAMKVKVTGPNKDYIIETQLTL